MTLKKRNQVRLGQTRVVHEYAIRNNPRLKSSAFSYKSLFLPTYLPSFSAMAVSAEHCTAMEEVGEAVCTSWDQHGRFIAGQKGFDATELLGIADSHPPFPIFMYMLGLLPMCSNGAGVGIWGKAEPCCLCILNVNHSQTRKSRLTSLAESVASNIDVETSHALRNILNAKLKEATTARAAKKRRVDAGDGDDQAAVDDDACSPFPGSHSVAYLGGTIERTRERASGDCCLVRQTNVVMRLPSLREREIEASCPDLSTAERAMAVQPGMQGRTWFGTGIIFDEAYQFLQDISILDKPTEKRGAEGPGSGQTPLAGWFNRLCQTGKSDHETKSNGAHGGLSCPACSVSLLGNFHPTPAIEMVRGERGDHGCQAKARLMLVTGKPVQPHEGYELEGRDEKAVWAPLDDDILAALEMSKQFKNVHAFHLHYGTPPP